KLFWARLEYLGIVAIPPTWAIFCARYLGTPAWLANKPRNQYLLGVIPAITVAIVFIPGLQHLIWTQVSVEQLRNVTVLHFSHGPWFTAYWTYAYGLLFLGTSLLTSRLFSSSRYQRSQVATPLLAILIALGSNLLYMSSLNPVPGLDWTPFSFSIAGLLLALSLFRYQLIAVKPIALQAVFERLEDVILVLDAESKILDANPAAEKLTGVPAIRLAGQSLEQAVPELAASIDPRESAENTQRLEVSLGAAPDPRAYELRVTPLFDRTTTARVGRVVVLHDVTQRKLEKELLRQARDELEVRVLERTEELRQANQQIGAELAQRSIAEKKFHEIVELAPDAMLLVDQGGCINLVNAQAERMFGLSKGSLTGRSILSLLPARLQDRLGPEAGRFFLQPEQIALWSSEDLFALRQEGTEFPVEVSASPLNTAEGLMVALVVRDISERKQAEQALRQSEDTYRTLFENANDAILLFIPEGRIMNANQKAADLLGYTREELPQLEVFDIIDPGEYPDARRKMRQTLLGKPMPLYERYYRRKDGSVFPVELNATLALDEQGKPRYIQAIARDITERKRAEQEQARLMEELSRSQTELRQLAARLQEVQEHERRQIAAELHDRVGQNLTGLNLNLQIIQNQTLPEAGTPLQSRLEDSLRLVEETTRQVRDVMADLVPPLLDEYGLASALRWYCEGFSRRLGIPVQASGQDGAPRLPRPVEIALFRIVQEALNNIARHAHASMASVTLDTGGDPARLTVQDNGAGFDSARLDAADEAPHLGLLTMKERAASVGGLLSLQSTPGEGTTIFVEVPRGSDGH
ncbi:MAG TPA: PAS domain S-box protein, partial [Anaerolineales bacterium]